MRRDGRHLYVDGYILKSNNEVAAEATAHFLIVNPNHELNDATVKLYLSDDAMPETVEF